MLVLSRMEGEEVILDDAIRLMVVRIEGDKVRIGIEAPRSVPVVREELLTPDARRRLLRLEGEA